VDRGVTVGDDPLKFVASEKFVDDDTTALPPQR
jgi:hypothetical protein